jgi:hypothetical protein
MLESARHVRPVEGLMDALRDMVPVNEPVPVPVITEVPGAPALTVTLVGFADSVKPPAFATVTGRTNVLEIRPPFVLLVPVNVTR